MLYNIKIIKRFLSYTAQMNVPKEISRITLELFRSLLNDKIKKLN
jgi:hypothetical protein